MIFTIFTIFIKSTLAYNLTDCISSDMVNGTSAQTVLDCENTCLNRNSTWFLMRIEECSCHMERNSSWSAMNIDECNIKCKDGLPCGGTARYSLYEIDSRRNVNIVDPQVNTITLGAGDGMDVRNTVRIAGITVGVLVFLGLIIFGIYCLKRKTQTKIPQIEENSVDNTCKFLIQDLLPMAPTGLYSVITAYKAQRGDEISLKVDQVVAIKEAYSDKWARGTNVTSGVQGYFPLTCLVSDEKYLKTGVEIPHRKRSLR